MTVLPGIAITEILPATHTTLLLTHKKVKSCPVNDNNEKLLK